MRTEASVRDTRRDSRHSKREDILHWKNGITLALVAALVTLASVGGFGWSWN